MHKKFKCACGTTSRATGKDAKKVMKPTKVKFKNTGEQYNATKR